MSNFFLRAHLRRKPRLLPVPTCLRSARRGASPPRGSRIIPPRLGKCLPPICHLPVAGVSQGGGKPKWAGGNHLGNCLFCPPARRDTIYMVCGPGVGAGRRNAWTFPNTLLRKAMPTLRNTYLYVLTHAPRTHCRVNGYAPRHATRSSCPACAV